MQLGCHVIDHSLPIASTIMRLATRLLKLYIIYMSHADSTLHLTLELKLLLLPFCSIMIDTSMYIASPINTVRG